MDEKTIIEANSKIYNLDVILKACNAFLDQIYIFLDCDQDQRRFKIILRGKEKLSTGKRKKIKGDFLDSLLHCALRYQIAKNDKNLRDLILGRVLYPFFSRSDVNTVSSDLDPSGGEKIFFDFQEKNRMHKTVFSSLELNNRIYTEQAISEAVTAYSDFAHFYVRKDKFYTHVQIKPYEFLKNEPLDFEFSNYVLALL